MSQVGCLKHHTEITVSAMQGADCLDKRTLRDSRLRWKFLCFNMSEAEVEASLIIPVLHRLNVDLLADHLNGSKACSQMFGLCSLNIGARLPLFLPLYPQIPIHAILYSFSTPCLLTWWLV